jgi:hypothetical protein
VRHRRTSFTHPDPATHVLQKLVLRAGADGVAKVIAKGRGGQIGLPGLPLTALPLRVQVVNGAGQCWEASYATTLANDAGRLKAKSANRRRGWVAGGGDDDARSARERTGRRGCPLP